MVGAVRLLSYDAPRRALLVERCHPGEQLWSVADDEEAARIGSAVLERIWRAAPSDHTFRRLADEAMRWARELQSDWTALGRPFERRVLDEGIAACSELGPDQGEHVVLHQDFHGGNVLRADREPRLAIDPKPLVGERSSTRRRFFAIGAGCSESATTRAESANRLDIMSSERNLDRERMRRWGIAHALVWGFSGQKVEEGMIECARLLLAAA